MITSPRIVPRSRCNVRRTPLLAWILFLGLPPGAQATENGTGIYLLGSQGPVDCRRMSWERPGNTTKLMRPVFC